MTFDSTRFPVLVSAVVVVLAVAGLAFAGAAAAQSDSGSNFDVRINDTNSPITENDTLEVRVTVKNTGDRTDNQEIVLETGDGTQRDSTTVALDPGASVTRNLTWNTGAGDAGEYEINVSSEDDTSTRTVTVNDVAEFDIDIDSVDEPVVEGETLAVETTVENLDNSADTQEIALDIDGRTEDSTTLALDGGESETLTLEWETDIGDAGDYEANVSSERDAESTGVSVNAGPTAVLTREPSVPDVNQAVTFDASESTDPDGEIVRYTWSVDGEAVSGSETFTYTFGEPGDHDVRLVVTDNDGLSAAVNRMIAVNEPPTASIPPANATVGEPVTIEANASDDGTVARYEWYVGGDRVSTSETLSYTFERSGTVQVRLEVTDNNGATTTTTRAVQVASDATATATATSTPTDTADQPGEEQPGFGPAVALLAVVVAALLVGRR